jgi:hypothetical protein
MNPVRVSFEDGEIVMVTSRCRKDDSRVDLMSRALFLDSPSE